MLSPLLFNYFMDGILREVMEMTGGGLQVEYTTSGGGGGGGGGGCYHTGTRPH